MFLYQIENRQRMLQQVHAQIKKAAPVATPILVEEAPPVDVAATPSVKEKTIAVALGISLHEKIEAEMQKLDFKGSKREFVTAVLNAAFPLS